MNPTVEKIYNLLFSPMITPFNLLENAKLDNYYYVNYYKGDSGLVAEMKCDIDGKSVIFYYHFDQQDKLLKIIMKDELEEKIMFDRTHELNVQKLQYKKDKSIRTITGA